MALIGMPGGTEVLIIALVLLLLFGGTKIPALMRGMGQGIREFRKELRGTEADEAPGGEETSNKTPAGESKEDP